MEKKPEATPKRERTEEQIVAKAAIEVILGGKKYEIAPLVIRDSRVWRKKVIELIAPLPKMVNVTMDVDNPEEFGDVLKMMMVTMPDQVLDLFFDYARDLNREEIEGIATDAEMSAAFEQVVKVAFPLAESLPGVMKHLSKSR